MADINPAAAAAAGDGDGGAGERHYVCDVKDFGSSKRAFKVCEHAFGADSRGHEMILVASGFPHEVRLKILD